MSKEMVVQDQQLSVSNVKAQIQAIQQIMQSVMKKDVHFGTIPGTGKPSLLKPGAEKIMMTFRIANELFVEDLSTEDENRYRVKSRAISILNGQFLGEGVGEASTSEEKYKWREAINESEFNDFPENKRRKKWKKGYGSSKDSQIAQVRTNPADLANTVLKMAKKRAVIDMVLTVTAASDIFTQDLEDDVQPEQVKKPVSISPAEKTEDKKTEVKMECFECGMPLDEKVFSYSKKYHGRPLCRDHQPKKAV